MRVWARWVGVALLGCTQPESTPASTATAAPSASTLGHAPSASTSAPTSAAPSAAAPSAAPTLEGKALATAAAGRGLKLGPAPKLAAPTTDSVTWKRAGTKLTAFAHAPLEGDEHPVKAQLRLRIEFAALPAPEFGLNYVAGGGALYCGELIPMLKEVGALPDGRWLIDAQLNCRSGEDSFSATNEHTLLLIDPSRPHAQVLWKGLDTGSDEAGICVSSSVTEFELEGETLRVTNTRVTTLNEQRAKQLPGPAEGCKPMPERTVEVARFDLKRAD